MEKRIPLIVDTDPGADDMSALVILSHYLDKFDLKLISSCNGDVSLDKTTKNICFASQKFLKRVRVAKGYVRPEDNIPEASDVHGDNGLCGYEMNEEIDVIPEPDAVESMYHILSESDDKVTIVTLGPMTNLARLLEVYPDIKSKIEKVYSMIGSIYGTGNITPYAEFNAYVDPKAFKQVAESGLHIIFNTIEVGSEARAKKDYVKSFNPQTEAGKMCQIMSLNIKESIHSLDEVCFYDQNSIMAMIRPDLFDFIPCVPHVSIDLDTFGQCKLEEKANGHCYYQIAKDYNELRKAICEEMLK